VVLDYSFGAASLALPAVLAKFGADVLAVNPYAATRVTTLGLSEREARVQRVGELVRASGSELGMVIDAGGESATLLDDRGRVLDAQQLLGVVLTLAVNARPGLRVALPVSVSRSVAEVVTGAGGEVVWSKTSAASIMETASRGDVDIAAAADGSVIWPDFLPAFDATSTLVHLLDLLARVETRVSDIADGLAPVHLARRAVTVEWARKGAVMREMVERTKGHDLTLVDGVKIDHGNGWALILPDPDEPSVEVIAEGEDDAAAAELADHYVHRIQEL
jgi:mannose-1-phosphate guanylyltransferase/phosphomannomutase